MRMKMILSQNSVNKLMSCLKSKYSFKNCRLLTLLFGGFGVFVMAIFLHSYYTYNFTENISNSLPGFLYQRVGDSSEIKQGDIVSACLLKDSIEPIMDALPRGKCGNGKITLLKMIGAKEGDYIEADGYAVVKVNGESLVGAIPTRDPKFNGLPKFIYTGKVPKGYVFLYTPALDGFDSRYFGLVRVETLGLKYKRLI